MIDKQFLAINHTGLRVSCRGVLGRISSNKSTPLMLRYGCEELLKHLQETATRFYAGDIKAVDEFFQLYCLDGNRPKDGE
ncbi:MAG: hypothetical protein WBN66_03650 [Smithella sp.]